VNNFRLLVKHTKKVVLANPKSTLSFRTPNDVEANFKFSTTILILVSPLTKIQQLIRGSLMKSEFHRKENRRKPELPKRAERKAESRESLQSYIGLIHPPLPDELKNLGGFTGTGDDSEYPYSVNLVQKGSERDMAGSSNSHDENERAVSKVVAPTFI